MIDLADKLQVPSRVEVDEERLVRVGSYVTGRIIDLYVMLGDSVNVGAPLARITSPELTQAQLAYLRAFSRTVLTQKAAERAHHLLAADVIAVAEVERRESELEVARAELEAAKDQLRLLGVDSAVLKELVKAGAYPAFRYHQFHQERHRYRPERDRRPGSATSGSAISGGGSILRLGGGRCAGADRT